VGLNFLLPSKIERKGSTTNLNTTELNVKLFHAKNLYLKDGTVPTSFALVHFAPDEVPSFLTLPQHVRLNLTIFVFFFIFLPELDPSFLKIQSEPKIGHIHPSQPLMKLNFKNFSIIY